MDETKLVKRVKEKRVPGQIKRGRPKKSWDEVVKEDMKKRGLCINDAQDRNKWRRCCRKVVKLFKIENCAHASPLHHDEKKAVRKVSSLVV